MSWALTHGVPSRPTHAGGHRQTYASEPRFPARFDLVAARAFTDNVSWVETGEY
jgi:hypothetical protein